MLSKLILSSGFISSSYGLRTPAHHFVRSPKVKDHKFIDPSNYWENEKCSAANDRLEDGPADPLQYSSTNKFSDATFEGTEQLWWDGLSTGDSYTWETYLDYDWYDFKRIQDLNSGTHPLFDSDGPHFNDISQGGAGTCYVLASMGAIAEFPELVTDMFTTGDQISDNGLYNFKFYIRGKPWIVTIDDYMLTDGENLVFTQPDPYSGAVWAALMEKAWAKIGGNYELSNGGYLESGLRSVAGVPVFTYWGSEFTTTSEAMTLWQTMHQADSIDYLLSAAVYFSDWESDTNACGIIQGHAYTVLSVFEMTEADGTVHQMYLIRNPWGVTYYSDDWNAEDSRWTDELAAQVPLGIDPRTSVEDGIFVLPYDKIIDEECISSLQIGHLRDSEGYTKTWFDEEQVSKETGFYDYELVIPTTIQDESYIYLTVESYYQTYVPYDCFSNSAGISTIYFNVENKRTGESWYKYYYEQYHDPMLIGPSSYQAGDTFEITVSNDWYGSPSRDYTVMAYLAVPEDSVFITTKQEGYANMMHMDGSKPTGFIESEWSTGVSHPMPNDPLRCFYYQDHVGAFKSCEEYGYTYDPTMDIDDGGDEGNTDDEDWEDWDDEDDDWFDDWCNGEDWCTDEEEHDDSDYPCSGLEHDHTTYSYTCTYDMWGELEACECVLNITCLRDIWVYSTNEEEFWDLLMANMWALFVWFSIHDVMNFLTKSFH